MTQYGVAVIGVGSAGGGFVNVFQNETRVELRAVCDTNEARLREVSEASGVSDACLDFRELAGRTDVDIVAICTPDHLHTEPAIAMMESGKHVIVEKPLAKTVTSFGTDRSDRDRGIELCGTDGFLVTGSEPGIGRGASKPEFEPIIAQDAGNLRSLLVSDLIDAIENDRQPLTNIAEAARTTAVCLAAYESAKTGGPVKVPPVLSQA